MINFSRRFSQQKRKTCQLSRTLNMRYLRYLHRRRILKQFASNPWSVHLHGQQSTTPMTNRIIRAVPQSATSLSAIASIASLASEGIKPSWLGSCHIPVRQRTVMGERTTKIKAGALPPAVYLIFCTVNASEERLRFPEENNWSSANAVPQRVISIQ